MTQPNIAGYEILGALGSGGMGTVYKARQISLDRIVALKVLSAQSALESTDVARFLQEARAAAQLSHEGMVRVYEAGEADGTYFIAMEYVEGSTLCTALNRDGALDEETALALVESVALALEHAWNVAGIIHRDIKPDNLLIDANGRIKVADLGLVKFARSGATLTVDGSMFCTPNYCSPEQAKGHVDLDCRTDIYSLGATLYHMLTGRIPFGEFEGTGPMVQQVTGVLEDPRQFEPGISTGAAELLRKMMARSPQHRFADWTAFVADLRRVRRGLTLQKPLPKRVNCTVAWNPPSPQVVARARPAPAAARKVFRKVPDARPSGNGEGATVIVRPVARTVRPTAVRKGEDESFSLVLWIILGIVSLVFLALVVIMPLRRQAQEQQVLRELESGLSVILQQIEAYAAANPYAFDACIVRLMELREKAIGTGLEPVVERRIAEFRVAREREKTRVMDQMRRNAERAAGQNGAAGAAALCRNYDGPMTVETAGEREEMAKRFDAAVSSIANPMQSHGVVTSAVSVAEAPPELPPDVKAALAKHEQCLRDIETQYGKDRQGIGERYLSALALIEKTQRQAGDLKAVKALSTEAERFRKSRGWSREAPADLPVAGRDLHAKTLEAVRVARTARDVRVQDAVKGLLGSLDDAVRRLTSEEKSAEAELVAKLKQKMGGISSRSNPAPDRPVPTQVVAGKPALPAENKAQSQIFDEWKYSMTLTFSGYKRRGVLTNFPALVLLSRDLDGFNFSQFTSPEGADLRFSDSAGRELKYEIDTWNPTAGKCGIWVQVPELSAGTSIRAFWGNPGAATFPAYTRDGAVWSEKYLAVWHMDASACRDSSGHGFRAVSVGAFPAGGKIGGAQRFIAKDQSCMQSGNVDSRTLTVSAWVNITRSAQNSGVIVSKGVDKGRVAYSLCAVDGATEDVPAGFAFLPQFRGAARKEAWLSSGVKTDLRGAGWKHVTGTFDGSTLCYYVNGELDSSMSVQKGDALPKLDCGVEIGRILSRGQYLCLDGLLDEVRISSVARSSDWIRACWANQSMPSSFVSYSVVTVQR